MAATPFYQQVHSTQKYRLGTEKKDAAGNSYVYLKGVSSLVAGDFVVYGYALTAVRSLDTTFGCVAVAMAAVDAATKYGWFLVDGKFASANVTTHSSGAGKALFLTSTAGRTIITPATEKVIYGAFTGGDAASNVGSVILRRPTASGDIST